jgi:hypothetical protein
MTSLLRLVAASIGLFVLVPFLFLAWHFTDVVTGRGKGMASLRGALVAIALIAFIGFATFSMHRLWHLKKSGLWSSVGLFAMLLALMLGSALYGASVSSCGLAITIGALVVLLLPRARQLCT